MRRWITLPVLALAMLAFAAVESQAQFGKSRGPAATPEEAWARLGAGPTDATFDLNKNPQAAMRLKYLNIAIPPDGIIRRDQYLAQYAQMAAQRSQGGPPGAPPVTAGAVPPTGDKPAVILVPGEEQPAPPAGGPPQRGPGGGGPPGMGGPPGGWQGRGEKDRGDKDRGDKGGDRGAGNGGGTDARKTDDIEEERPNVLRYGKTPKELPSWFVEFDTDKDAQIGLYEWRAKGMSIDEFIEKDLNGDGFLTADEVLKSPRLGSAEAKPEASKGAVASKSNDPRMNGSGKIKGEKDKDRTDNKPSKEDKKPAEPTGGNPFLKNKG